jgi:uncharacterized protein
MKHQESGLVIDSRSLPRQPGASLRVRAVFDPAGLANDVTAVPSGDVAVDVLLESVLDGILVTGTADVPYTAECVRCLDPAHGHLDIRFQQLFTYPGAQSDGEEGDGADVAPMAGDDLDVTEAFRDAALLALPFTPKCRPDCPGLCPACGFRLADDLTHGHEHTDPRWSGLASWRSTGAAPEGE